MKEKKAQQTIRFSGDYIARNFLEYFEQRGHTIRPSAPIVPDDPTLLFTAAGMVQFKSYYSDPDAAPFPTATTVQKCLRAGGKQSDLENVGRTLRHHTFFEMLGNFSFGDYFKREAIDFAWDLSVDVWGIDRDRIWISIYQDDDEAHDLWVNRIGLPKKRVVRLGKKDNFWGPVGDTGVCGPSSELHYDTGEERGCDKPTCGPGCDCDRYIEFWNLVFPQFFLTEEGRYDPLPKPGIDTGMGLERVAFILQGVEDNFHTDIFLPIRDAVTRALPNPSQAGEAALAINVATDHVRALTFGLSEGVMPSNEGRGYVMRRLLRRALTKMHPFGVKQPFLASAVDAVVATMGERYPELLQHAPAVKKWITSEEQHFLSTLELGWNKLQEVLERAGKKKGQRIAGKEVFVLYDTYGFPPELTSELAREAGLAIDEAGFEEEMSRQKERSRRNQQITVGEVVSPGEELDYVELHPVEKTEFLGYEELSTDATLGEFRVVDEATVDAVTDKTVFYPEGGGQVADTGTATFGERRTKVVDAFREDERIVHRIEIDGDRKEMEALLRSDPGARLAVDRGRRLATARNHTATHLMHAALRSVLGDHVKQAGSLVAPDRLRFDFHHYAPMKRNEIRQVEDIVNDAIIDDMTISWEIIPYKEAIAQGATALFGEKYGDRVRVVSIEDFSKELCGGTHLDHTGEIGAFILTHETAVGAGVRRVEAITGRTALQHVQRLLDEREAVAQALKTAPDDIDRRVRTLLEDNETLRQKLAEQQGKVAGDQLDEALAGGSDINGIRLVSFKTQTGDLASLRRWGDYLRDRMTMGVGLLGLVAGKKPVVLITVSDSVIKDKGLAANELASTIASRLSLRGGGKPHLAQLGITGAEDFAKVESLVRSTLENLK